VAIPSARLSKSDEEVDIKPGMAVTVDIIGKKRSVLSYIFTPLNRAAGVVFREN
jgi:multidrug efflux pump subunit AcrA (membrane-fusion protein)